MLPRTEVQFKVPEVRNIKSEYLDHFNIFDLFNIYLYYNM